MILKTAKLVSSFILAQRVFAKSLIAAPLQRNHKSEFARMTVVYIGETT